MSHFLHQIFLIISPWTFWNTILCLYWVFRRSCQPGIQRVHILPSVWYGCCTTFPFVSRCIFVCNFLLCCVRMFSLFFCTHCHPWIFGEISAQTFVLLCICIVPFLTELWEILIYTANMSIFVLKIFSLWIAFSFFLTVCFEEWKKL